MTVDFCENFWGDKNNGFDVLYHNMKYGQVACKELSDFIRERASAEENQSKLLLRLAKTAGNSCALGTFAPLWQVLKSTCEKLSAAHTQMFQKFQELIKEVIKYCDEQHKRHKQIKEEESGTQEAVQCIQSTTVLLLKAKEAYVQRAMEYEKLKRENGSLKELEKADQKFKKACDDYKTLVDKYCTVRSDFEAKMRVSCQHFKEIEVNYLTQMKEFLLSYAQVLQNGHLLVGQVYFEFNERCSDMTTDKLIEQFIANKATGTEPPGAIYFEEVDLTSLPPAVTIGDQMQTLSADGSPISGGAGSTMNVSKSASKMEGFLKSRREKRKEKKRKKKGESLEDAKSDVEDKDVKNNNTGVSPNLDIANLRVDNEGYSIRPTTTEDTRAFNSSSESDSEDDMSERRIHIEIKPLSNGMLSASIDELRASVGTLQLAAAGTTIPARRTPVGGDYGETVGIKKSQSVTHVGKASCDLAGLQLYPSPEQACSMNSPNSYSAVTLSNISSPSSSTLQSPNSSLKSSDATPTQEGELADLFHVTGDLPPALPPKQNSSIGIAPPYSRTIGRRSMDGRGRMSPSAASLSGASSMSGNSMSRAESANSIASEFRASSMSIGSSRGPSPLTLGMSDTIPLAVAFQETIHCYFKGTDPSSSCQVKVTGDMMVSFPAGIVPYLANNIAPSMLTFRIKHVQKLDSIVSNKQLIAIDDKLSQTDNHVYEFNMAALTALLRRQAEQNPTAAYFNVDILKYQVRASTGAGNSPLHLVAYWKCERSFTDLRLDYKYNAAAMFTPLPLLNISFIVPVDGGVQSMQSKPTGQWSSDTGRALWKMPDLSQFSDDSGVGSVRARFDVTNGPSQPNTIAVQFSCEGTTLSGIDFELVGLGYRLSLIKRRFISGKYICETDPDMRYRYAPPPC